MTTRVKPTKVVITEDLLMFTDSKYPYIYCPKTSAEELFGHQGDVVNKEGVRIFISRGYADPQLGHYVYLLVDHKLWMTTDKQEKGSMRLAALECPFNARVYIGGLGLGLILLELAHFKKAKEVMVVERDLRVIKIVEPIIRKWFDKHYPDFKLTLIYGDAVEEIDKHGLWDWIFFDIWSDGSGHRQGEPKPEDVREKAKNFLTPRGQVTIWTMVVEKMRETHLDTETQEKVDKLFDIIKNPLHP